MKYDYNRKIQERAEQYGDKFSEESLAPQFIPYYENNARIEVEMGGEIVRGRVGITTGWKPCFLLMRRTSDSGSSYTLGKEDKILRVVSA